MVTPELDVNTITIIVAIIGAVTGAVSLAITIYKIRKERPLLDFAVEKAQYAVLNPNDRVTYINMLLRINNRGHVSTSIYTIILSFDYNSQHYTLQPYAQNKIINIPPNLTISENLMCVLENDRIETNPSNCTLDIKYTHGQKSVALSITRKPD